MEFKGKKMKFVHTPIFADFVSFGYFGYFRAICKCFLYFLTPLNTAFRQTPLPWSIGTEKDY